MSIAHRPAGAEYRNFVVSGWLSSFRNADSSGMIADGAWFDVMRPQVERVLDGPGVAATVAYETSNDDPATNAYGFIVADTSERLVFYVYVKQVHRRSGVARGLFAAIGVDPEMPFNYVCSTPWVSRLARKIPMARWTPRLGRYPKHERRST